MLTIEPRRSDLNEFSNLDVRQGRKSGAPSENRTQSQETSFISYG